MNRRYLVIGMIIGAIIILLFADTVTGKTAWSICDPTDPNTGEHCRDVTIPAAEAKGYWSFSYDDAAPFVTAGLYCCWWERWYKWNKFSQWKDANTMNLGSSSVETKSYTPGTVGTSEVKASPTLTQIQPEDGYCPSCCSICDDQTAMELQAKSDAIMAKKPWLTEGKNKGTALAGGSTTTASVTAAPTVAQMSFSEAV